MLKVLYVSAAAEKGGQEVILLSILKCLDRSHFIPQVLFLMDGPFVKEVQEAGIRAHVIDVGRVRQIVKGRSAVAAVTRLIRDEAFDIVHTHNSKAHIYGGLAARFAGIPSVLHLQGVSKPSFSRDGLISLLSVVIPARRTIACANWVAKAFKGAWGLRRNVLVIHSGVMTEGVDETNGARTARQEFAIPDGAPLVVMASRLQRWKGVHVFLESAAHVVRKHPEARFMVVGGSLFGLEENYAEELRNQVERLGLGGVVVFTGYRPDVSRFFVAADVVVHSSIEPDPFPTVLLEAMVWGKPVVAPDLGGPREIVEAGVTGLLVPHNDAVQLANAILTLVADRERRVRMGQAGAARVRARFNAEAMVRQIEEVYVQMVNEKMHQ